MLFDMGYASNPAQKIGVRSNGVKYIIPFAKPRAVEVEHLPARGFLDALGSKRWVHFHGLVSSGAMIAPEAGPESRNRYVQKRGRTVAAITASPR